MTTHAEQRNTQSATAQMQPHLDRTAREREDLDRRIRDHQSRTARS